MDPAEAYEASVLARNEQVYKLIERGGSEIQNFYSDAVIFVTGGSGFLGKQLIEKIFRSCRDVMKVYMLLRPKKGKSGQERLPQLLKDPVYESLYKSNPNFMEKIELVEGDVSQIGLGMSEENWKKITETVDIIFNVAATVSFDQPIKTATLTNVRGAREILILGKACKRLRSLVHVSTAYSHATSVNIKGEILEQFYPSPIDPGALISMAETVEDSRLDDMTPQLIKNWPNTYTFTKAVAEELVRTMSEDLPVCIVRPVIVFGSYLEPTPGWVDVQTCFSGPPGFIFAPTTGLVHVMLSDTGIKLDIVPVDMVNNAIFAAGWETANRWIKGERGTIIYTITGIHGQMSIEYLQSVRSGRRFQKNVFSNLLIRVYTRYTKTNEVMQYFLTNVWLFGNTNTMALFRKMSSDDQIIYNFDMAKVNYRELIVMWYLGQRRYVLKDGLKGTKKAALRQKWLKLLNYFVLFIYVYVIFKFCVLTFSCIRWCIL